MGIWFMEASLDNLIAGLVAGQISSLPMQDLFTLVASVPVIARLIYLIVSPLGKVVAIYVFEGEKIADNVS